MQNLKINPCIDLGTGSPKAKAMSKVIIFLSLFLFFQTALALRIEPGKIKGLDVETKVETKGIVIVEPGILGLQIFYLDGVQIYSYYKDFPDLKIGDEILVKGEISQSRGEKRIKIKTKEDIVILNSSVSVEPKFLTISSINNQFVGNLIKIKGLVIEKAGQEIFINDNTGELTIYIKPYASVNKSIIKEGDNVEITGILSQNNDELRLLPRGNQDLVIKNKESIEQKQIKQIQLLTAGMGTLDFYKLKPYFTISAIILGLIFITLLLVEKYKR